MNPKCSTWGPLQALLTGLLMSVGLSACTEPGGEDPGEVVPPMMMEEEDEVCEGVQVLHLSGQVLDIEGGVPSSRNFTLCGGACIRGELEEDGSFVLETDFCFLRNPPLTRPVFIYHGVGIYSDLYFDFVPEDADVIERAELDQPLFVVSIEAMKSVQVPPEGEVLLSDDEGFVLKAEASEIEMPLSREKIAVRRIEPAHYPPIPGTETLTALYATLPEGVVFTSPAELHLPNLDGLAPGDEVEIMGIGTVGTQEVFAGTLGQIAVGVVSEDGASIVTRPGEGITELTWLGFRPFE